MSTEFFQKKHRKATKIGSWKKPKSFRGRKKTKIKEKKNGREQIKNFSKEEKDKGHQYDREHCKNLSEEKKQSYYIFSKVIFSSVWISP